MGENNTPDQRLPSNRAGLRAAVVPVLALAAVLAGCLVAWNGQVKSSFGWFAYAPLSNDFFSGSSMVLVTQGTQIGLAIAVAGLLVLAFWAGFRLGRRPRRQL
ncbi:hypothetical protein [Pseudarthrobacter enclensis]|uniref:hypothetical protein n=1 Tax=Pseudarthrobacter enclensis TaxID=993070 RepID=UPI003EDE9397